MASELYLQSLNDDLLPRLNAMTDKLFSGQAWVIESTRSETALINMIDSDHWAMLYNPDGSVAVVSAQDYKTLSDMFSSYGFPTADKDGETFSEEQNFLSRLPSTVEGSVVAPLISRPFAPAFDVADKTGWTAGQKMTRELRALKRVASPA